MLHPDLFFRCYQPAYHNFNKSSVPNWSYPNQYMSHSQYMNKTEIIITTLHRANGDTTPLSHIINHLTNTHLHILFLLSRRINWLRKEDGNLIKSWVTNSNSKRLKIPSKFSSHRSLLYFSRRTWQLRKKVWKPWFNAKIIHSIW